MLHLLFGLLAPPHCAGCDARLSREAAFCGGCLASLEKPPRLPPGTTASFAYGGALGDAIRSVKYDERVDRLRALCRLVVERLPSREAIDAVAPVPLHRDRLRARGFDQAGVLARAVARALRLPMAYEIIERRIPTGSLASLDAEGRKRAVEGAFVAHDVKGARILLVDDVRTTGATTNAAIAAIEAGGGHAIVHVLAATPKG
ncbi:MAG: ComF family protein [Polyangiales bacterium]